MAAWNPDLGLYVHVPFCVHKCFYCDFATSPFQTDVVPAFLSALKLEAAHYGARVSESVGSVFLGGGTPSLLTADQMADLLQWLRRHFQIAPDAEITVETNPETVDDAKLSAYRDAGVNRLSFGVQVFDEAALRALGRDHSIADVNSAYESARRVGFDNINLDLIFALPNQSLADWQATANAALRLKPEHLSIYNLTIEPKTVFSFLRRKGSLSVPDEDIQAAMYEWTLDAMDAAGYPAYEISNFARPGFECRHNLRYWRNEPHVAVGPSACGYLDGERYGNVRGTKSYVKRMDEGLDPVIDRERLTGTSARAETVIQGLRLRAGVELARYEARYGAALTTDFGDEIKPLVELQLLEWTDDALRLTRRGLLVANEVFARLLPDGG